jgi:hypothetical protein
MAVIERIRLFHHQILPDQLSNVTTPVHNHNDARIGMLRARVYARPYRETDRGGYAVSGKAEEVRLRAIALSTC